MELNTDNSRTFDQLLNSKEAVSVKGMARPGGLELPTFWFVARRSIQLSYGRTVVESTT